MRTNILKTKILFLILVIFFTLSCGSDNGVKPKPENGALKYVIINDSDNIIDKVYFHSDYNNYKLESNALDIDSLGVGERVQICPMGNEYITFKRSLSEVDDKKIYVTSSTILNYKYGIITIKLGDSNFYISESENPKKECSCIGNNCLTE